jgi:hypothetical protein
MHKLKRTRKRRSKKKASNKAPQDGDKTSKTEASEAASHSKAEPSQPIRSKSQEAADMGSSLDMEAGHSQVQRSSMVVKQSCRRQLDRGRAHKGSTKGRSQDESRGLSFKMPFEKLRKQIQCNVGRLKMDEHFDNEDWRLYRMKDTLDLIKKYRELIGEYKQEEADTVINEGIVKLESYLRHVQRQELQARGDRRSRLAKEQVPTFDGVKDNFEFFWTDFKNVVLKDTSLEPQDQLRMLRKALLQNTDKDLIYNLEEGRGDVATAEKRLRQKYLNSARVQAKLKEEVCKMGILPERPSTFQWQDLLNSARSLEIRTASSDKTFKDQLLGVIFEKLPWEYKKEFRKRECSFKAWVEFCEENLAQSQSGDYLLQNHGFPGGRGHNESYPSNGRGYKPMYQQQGYARRPQGAYRRGNWNALPRTFAARSVNAVGQAEFREQSHEFEENNKSFLSYDHVDEPLVIKGSVKDQPVKMLLDTGAKPNLLPSKFAPQAEMRPRFKSATQDTIKASRPMEFELKVNGNTIPIKACTNDQNLSILGRDFTRKCSMLSDGNKIKEVIYHRGGKRSVIYRRTEKPTTRPMQQIYQILPCAMENDLDDEDDDEKQAPAWIPVKAPALNKLLERWRHLGEGLGDTDKVLHSLHLKPNTKPINCKERRLPHIIKEKAKAAIEEMLRLGVIEESRSEWCSSIVPVQKKDGTIRVAVDFRPLNEVCQKDAYPMPRIDEITEKLNKAKVFSKLDLVKGYYQVRIAPEDRDKTAFRFGKNLYQFTRMPFGLSAAPQTFQRLMNDVLRHLPFAACYLDDIVIFSASLEEHIQHLEAVFKALEEANLKINRDKCEFATQEVEYLGLRIGNGCRSPTSAKIEKLQKFPTPSNKKDLSSFLGIAGQYRDLIENYAAKTKCLYDLKAKITGRTKFTWSDEHEKTFQELKKELTRPPVVMLPDFSKPFIVKTDASGTGMGGVLLQEVDGQRRIIEFASKQFKGAQLRYPTIEKEATAIDFALKKWRHYLLGGGFQLETDHRPLQFLNSMKNTHGKLARMAIRVQEFQPFKIIHIPGKDNHEADYLSRLVGAITLDYSLQDDIFYRKRKNPSEFVTDGQGRFRFVGDGKDRLAIPKGHRQEIMRSLHDQHGHLALERVLDLARNRFFWPDMTKDIKKYISECHKCSVAKDAPIPKAEMKPTTIEVNEPFSRWHVDVIGPFTVQSTLGNKYVVVAQDAFSKWPEAKPISACTTEAITSWIDTAIIQRFGLPDEIMSDQGSQFQSREFKRFAETKGFKSIESAPYHHQTNGVVERFNRTLEQMIRTTCDETNKWDQVVDQCLFSYRTTKHKVTKKTPFEITYGKLARLPVDGQLALEAPELTQNHMEIRQEVKEAIVNEAEKAKLRYDRTKNIKARDLDGQKVYWKNLTANPKEGKHLAPRYRGPFQAEKTESSWNYRITDRDGNTKTVHMDQLKPCRNEEPLASGLRGRGRPRRLYPIRVIYNSNRKQGERCEGRQFDRTATMSPGRLMYKPISYQ